MNVPRIKRIELWNLTDRIAENSANARQLFILPKLTGAETGLEAKLGRTAPSGAVLH
jgi:hypothetical protein